MELDRPIDINTEQRKTILALLARHLPNTTAWVYGSRVKWTSSPKSDLDLVVFATPEQSGRVSDLREAFEESNLPFRVDLFVWDDVPEPFRKQIEAEHVVLVEKNEMDSPSTWQRIALGEIVEIFDGPHATPKKTERGPIFLGISNLVSGRLDLAKTEHLSEEDYSRWTRRVTPRSGDVVFSYETRLGEAALIPTGLRCCLGRRMGLLRPKGEKVESCFLLYAFLGTRFQETLRSRTVHGSTVDRILLNEMGGFPIDVPRKLEEQRAIAHALGTLDDKIELNRQMNETLEEIARALFQSWFVDFDPVHAKAALKHHAANLTQWGSDWSVERARAYLERMAPDIAALFPDSFVDSKLGPIPVGWEVKELGELVELAYGKALKAKDRKIGAIPVYGSNGQVGWHDKELVVGPGIIVGRKGNPGMVTRTHSDFFPIDTTFYVIPRDTIYRLTFLFFALIHQDLPSVSADSAVPGLNRNLAYMNRQVIPPELLVEEFNECASAIFTRSYHLEAESRTLSDLRDALLPKLLSGEVRVNGGVENGV